MNEPIDFSADYIQVEDITDRVDELRDERDEYNNPDAEHPNMAEWADANAADAEELENLESILEDLQGNGGDHQWEGNWYPQTLIAEREFENAMDELIADIGEIPVNLPSYLKVVVDYDALRQDYTPGNFGGYDFLYR